MRTDSDQLHMLYEMNRRLATFTDLGELLRYATRRTRELLDAEGCSVLLLDSSRREFYFPVASQSESRRVSQARLAEVRFPADRGLAGWVLSHDKAAAVHDAASDPRFYDGIDCLTDMTTRSLLCAPLRTRTGNIGVVEVVNPVRGADAEDLEFLEALAGDIAVAHEKTFLYDRLRDEVIGLRQVCGVAGGAMGFLGLAFSAAAAYTHLARALPWRELPGKPGMLMGLVCLSAGLLLVTVARGWLVRRTGQGIPTSP